MGSRTLLDDALLHGSRSIEILGRRPPTDSLVLAHAYLSEIYLYRSMSRKDWSTTGRQFV